MIRKPFGRKDVIGTVEFVIRHADNPMLDDAMIRRRPSGSILLRLQDGSTWVVDVHPSVAGQSWDDGDDSPES